MLEKMTIFSSMLLASLLLISQQEFAQNQIPVSIISNGGERSSSPSYLMLGTVGESFIGKVVNTSYQHQAGFWYVYKQSTVTNVDKENETIPNVFQLEQNYPNPFNPSTIIKFGIPERSNVVLKIYDLLGSEVQTLVNNELEPGWYSRYFNASGYSSGIYIYRLQAGTYINTMKMILVK
jgi:hypothetical protein